MGAGVEQWTDLTSQVELTVSSRPAMIASLTDGSTGTNSSCTDNVCLFLALYLFFGKSLFLAFYLITFSFVFIKLKLSDPVFVRRYLYQMY
jgi:hypothetical protein